MSMHSVVVYTETFLSLCIATDKRGYPHNNFIISGRIHMLWVLIRSASVRPLRGASNEYPQHMFFIEK